MQEGEKIEDCTNPENYELLFSIPNLPKCPQQFAYSAKHGMIAIGFQGGYFESFRLDWGDEENVPAYEEESQKLVKGHLTITKAVRWVRDMDELVGTDQEETKVEENEMVEAVMFG